MIDVEGARKISGVCLSPNGSRLATASFDGTIKIWDPETGQQLLQTRPASPFSGVPARTRLASSFPGRTEAQQFSPQLDKLHDARFSVDGKLRYYCGDHSIGVLAAKSH